MLAYVLKEGCFVWIKTRIPVEELAAWDRASGVAMFYSLWNVRNLNEEYRVLDLDKRCSVFRDIPPKDIVCRTRAIVRSIGRVFNYYALVNDGDNFILMSRESYKEWFRNKHSCLTSKGLVFTSRYLASKYADISGAANYEISKCEDGFRVMLAIDE